MSKTPERRALSQRKVGYAFRSTMEARTEPDLIRNELTHRITAYVLSDHIADDEFTAEAVFEQPDSWWQMFKLQHWERWFIRFWVLAPPRMKASRQTVKVQVERYLGYPEASIQLPEMGRPVIFEQARQMRAWKP